MSWVTGNWDSCFGVCDGFYLVQNCQTVTSGIPTVFASVFFVAKTAFQKLPTWGARGENFHHCYNFFPQGNSMQYQSESFRRLSRDSKSFDCHNSVSFHPLGCISICTALRTRHSKTAIEGFTILFAVMLKGPAKLSTKFANCLEGVTR